MDGQSKLAWAWIDNSVSIFPTIAAAVVEVSDYLKLEARLMIPFRETFCTTTTANERESIICESNQRSASGIGANHPSLNPRVAAQVHVM